MPKAAYDERRERLIQLISIIKEMPTEKDDEHNPPGEHCPDRTANLESSARIYSKEKGK